MSELQVQNPSAEQPWMVFAGLVESGDPHSSESIDAIVYASFESRGEEPDLEVRRGRGRPPHFKPRP